MERSGDLVRFGDGVPPADGRHGLSVTPEPWCGTSPVATPLTVLLLWMIAGGITAVNGQ